jgi:hypothetical protein
MKTEHPQEGSSRVEREILEILERADSSKTPVDNLQAAVRRQRASARARAPRAPRIALSPELLRIGGALFFAIGAAAIADISRLLAMVLAIASVVALFSLWFPSRPSGIGETQRWRGRDLRDQSGPPGFDLERIWPWRGPNRPSK